MKFIVPIGKGGVGKSTSAVSLGLHYSRQIPTVVFDYDGGNSIQDVLVLKEKEWSHNQLHHLRENFYFSIIQPKDFKSISEFDKGKKRERYWNQFDEFEGLIPYHDMVSEFWGLVTAIDEVSKLTNLTKMYFEAKQNGVELCVIDVEPTGGLERSLKSGIVMAQRLQRLKKIKFVVKPIVKGLGWNDVLTFLDGPFMDNIDYYVPRMEEAIELFRNACFFIVCNPQEGTVNETDKTKRVINKIGGQVGGYIINNVRLGEPDVASQIQRVYRKAKSLPVVEVHHDSSLYVAKDIGARYEALFKMGEHLHNSLF